MAGSGSIAPEEVVPTVATTTHGTSPASRSAAMAAARATGSMAWSASVAIDRSWSAANPATRTPFSTDEWACEDV